MNKQVGMYEYWKGVVLAIMKMFHVVLKWPNIFNQTNIPI